MGQAAIGVAASDLETRLPSFYKGGWVSDYLSRPEALSRWIARARTLGDCVIKGQNSAPALKLN
ncbi:hypothetical protein Sinac_2643 [Singulisphaera acidiphila DSM 18658]|uniref:Uncharacterized protein n=1 Tax=Singulisphaera acidiphila (strain ATCC BAA-1392 / DSM 18658 / VKM B-2454 / MOB10) TaxID=886293 RepID=L0DDL3_SINAD|nr:hypothetical protein Sinac_2643 [Singulisphaera acidiphila DSM 18658]